MLFLLSPFLVALLCSVRRVFRFLPVSPAKVAGQSLHLILCTAPCLSFGSSLSLTLVSSCRKVVIGNDNVMIFQEIINSISSR